MRAPTIRFTLAALSCLAMPVELRAAGDYTRQEPVVLRCNWATRRTSYDFFHRL